MLFARAQKNRLFGNILTPSHNEFGVVSIYSNQISIVATMASRYRFTFRFLSLLLGLNCVYD